MGFYDSTDPNEIEVLKTRPDKSYVELGTVTAMSFAPAEEAKMHNAIRAKAANRAIEVEFESLTPKTTRMRVVADSESFFKDSATATEIILQTERALPAT